MKNLKFLDGLVSFVSSLINRRNASSQNGFEIVPLSDRDRRAIYLSGIGNKIARIKSGYALKDSIEFQSVEDEEFYKKRLAKHVKLAAQFMIGFGRGIIVLHHRGDNLAEPLGQVSKEKLKIDVFSGDMVTASNVDRDLQSQRYYKPIHYNVRGYNIHWTRVIDFTYVQPPELLAPNYRYGGVSEYDLIYEQLIADGIVQRASPKIIEKASTLFYKVTGFKEALSTGTETDMVAYFSQLEDIRGIHSAGLIDAADEIESVQQTIANLADADQITLRRLAMVTSIPLAILVGENVRGLNSTGDNERTAFQDMLEEVQSSYLLDPITELMAKTGQGEIDFKENQGETANDRMDYETKAIDNAVKLASIGEDFIAYLNEKGVTKKDEFSQVFNDNWTDDDETRD